LLGVLLACSWQALAQVGSGDFRARWWARWRFFCGFSYAALLAGHFVLSWGSNLQFLPVMGQPMPFLSVAGSMTILFLVPLQALFLFNPARPRQG
jgi:cell division protein FtsW